MRAWILLALGCGAPDAAPDPNANSDGDCLTDTEERELGTDPSAEDSDGDELDDCSEVRIHGSDPLAVDGDGDGVSDPDEVACVSDPADADEVCYACGWPHGDPGDLVPSGADVGDVVADITLWDQCGEPLRLHDLAGSHVMLFVTTLWCGTCIEEAKALAEEADSLAADAGVPLLPVIALFEDAFGDAAQPTDGATYADGLELSGFPVTGDPAQATISELPYDGAQLPGRCLLSPDMVILGCETGAAGIEAVREWLTD